MREDEVRAVGQIARIIGGVTPDGVLLASPEMRQWHAEAGVLEKEYDLSFSQVHNFARRFRSLPDRVLALVAQHERAFLYLLDQEVLTPFHIRSAHTLLMAHKPDIAGQYRTGPAGVRTSVGVYTFADPALIPSRLSDVIRPFQDDRPLSFVAEAHNLYVDIHPHADGNGRMARILVNVLLIQNGYPPLVFARETHDEYLRALEQYNTSKDSTPMAALFLHMAESVWPGVIRTWLVE